MAEHTDLLDNVVNATAKLFKQSKIAKNARDQIRRIEERDNAVSPASTKGKTTPEV